MGEVIVITSGKGGVGKTTCSANIGTGLAKLGYKVILVDTDIGLRNLDVVMGLENRIVYNLVDVIEGKCRIKHALIRSSEYDNLYLLPSAQTKDKTSVTPWQMQKLATELSEEADYVILDCPAGIEQGFKNAIAGASHAIVITTPEVSAIRDADRVIGILKNNNSDFTQITKISLIINKIRTNMVKKHDMLSPEDVVEMLGVDLLGILPDDDNIVISTNKGIPLAGDSTLAGTAFSNICSRITGSEVPFLDLELKKSFFSKLFNK